MPYDKEKDEESGGYARERGKMSKREIHAAIGKKFEEMMALCAKLKDGKEDDDGEDE